MKILGTKFFGHDSSIFILDLNRKEIFGLSTERVTRVKHDWQDVGYILKYLSNKYPALLSKIDYVVHSFNNFGNVDTCLETKAYFLYHLEFDKIIREIFGIKYIKDYDKIRYNLGNILLKLIKNRNWKGFKIYFKYLLNKNKIFSENKNRNKITNYINSILQKYNIQAKIDFKNHHLSHAAATYYFSPFNEEAALVFILDGQGDGIFHSLWYFKKNKYKLLHKSEVKIENGFFTPYSIGHIYSAFTAVLGFTPNADEGKTEALAAYGEVDPELYKLLSQGYNLNKKLLKWELNVNILHRLHDINYLIYWKDKIGDANFAATIQRWLEDTVVEYLIAAYKKYKISNLALAGGVVANVIMNLKIFEKTPFKKIYIYPAMGDEGTAAGAAILKALDLDRNIYWLKEFEMPYWGPKYSQKEIETILKLYKQKGIIEYIYIGDNWPKIAAKMIAKGKVIAIFQGNIEFGPRALGNRSILADPRNPETRNKLNLTVKRRPWFQPFCPSVLEEEREKLFEKSYKHKHMAIAFRIKKEYRNKIPSAMHIDGTARPQFVERKDNPKYYELLQEFKKITGYGLIINTSFNLHGRTIVLKPEDAIQDFLESKIDALFMEGFLIEKNVKN